MIRTHTCKQFLNLHASLRLDCVFVCLFWFSIFRVLCVSLDHFIPMLPAFVALGLVSSAN